MISILIFFFFVFYLKNKPSSFEKYIFLFKILLICNIVLFSLNRQFNLFNGLEYLDKQDQSTKLNLDITLSLLIDDQYVIIDFHLSRTKM
jgi:hypothetical protein